MSSDKEDRQLEWLCTHLKHKLGVTWDGLAEQAGVKLPTLKNWTGRGRFSEPAMALMTHILYLAETGQTEEFRDWRKKLALGVNDTYNSPNSDGKADAEQKPQPQGE